MMRLANLAELLEGILYGDPDTEIKDISSFKDAKGGEITFIAHKRYLKDIKKCKASAIIVSEDVDIDPPYPALIKVKNPYLAFAKLLEIFYPKEKIEKGVSDRAFIGEDARIGEEVTILPFVFIGDGSEIKNKSIIYPFTFIGKDVLIGEETIIYANVSIYDNTKIGNRVIIHSGAVIGSDGYGFVKKEDETYYKIPHAGCVVIEDDVEIGANVCIDRANLGETIIKRGVKFDNLCHVAHNVVIGENSLIVAQVGISGSCNIGKGVVLGGQVGVVDHINVGDKAMILAQSGIAQDIEANSIVSGSPTMPHNLWRRVQVSLPKLPDLIKTVHMLEKRLDELEKGEKGL